MTPKVQQLVKFLKGFQPKLDFTIEFMSGNSNNVGPSIDVINANDDDFSDDGDYDDESEAEMEDDRSQGVVIQEVTDSEIAADKIDDNLDEANLKAPLFNPSTIYRAIPKLPQGQDGKPEEETVDDGGADILDERLCGLVFVRDRFAAYALSRLLEEICVWDADLYFVRPGHLYALHKDDICKYNVLLKKNGLPDCVNMLNGCIL